ncbi:MAG TPA: NnrS family protein, partial [Paracoccus sp. (in: a-proteobacteria)]|nr:NnrS family protein [Paracoccus sp. (in: a-proteobacteria)]
HSAAGRPAPLPWAAPAAAAFLTLTSLVWAGAALAAAAAVLWQTRRWPRGAWRHGAGAMLAGAWLALAAGLALRGLAGHLPLPQAAGVHLLGMGAMGGMIVAISGRAGMRRVDGCPRAGRLILTGFALIQTAALLRLAAAGQPGLIHPAAALWSAGWAVWLLTLRPVLSGP